MYGVTITPGYVASIAPRTASHCGPAVGEMGVDWKGQFAALLKDGYKGWVSLETHWPGPGGDKHLASMICGRNLKAMATA